MTSSNSALKSLLVVLVAVAFLFLEDNYSHAWEKAIWPFNTPNIVSKQICKNSKDWVKSAYHCNDQPSRANLLSHMYANKRFSLKNDPSYREWHIIYYREMELYVRTIWKNPNITEDMAIEITQNICKTRQKNIQKQLEKTNPKR